VVVSKYFKYQFVRFLAVGVLNTIFGYSCYALFLYLELAYPIALFFSTIVSVLFNFKTTGKFVFQSSNNRLIVRFMSTYLIVYAVNVLCIKSLAYFDLNPYYAGAIVLLPMALFSYFLNKKLVFSSINTKTKLTP
jgi:putative flippase GtrA